MTHKRVKNVSMHALKKYNVQMAYNGNAAMLSSYHLYHSYVYIYTF